MPFDFGYNTLVRKVWQFTISALGTMPDAMQCNRLEVRRQKTCRMAASAFVIYYYPRRNIRSGGGAIRVQSDLNDDPTLYPTSLAFFDPMATIDRPCVETENVGEMTQKPTAFLGSRAVNAVQCVHANEPSRFYRRVEHLGSGHPVNHGPFWMGSCRSVQLQEPGIEEGLRGSLGASRGGPRRHLSGAAGGIFGL